MTRRPSDRLVDLDDLDELDDPTWRYLDEIGGAASTLCAEIEDDVTISVEVEDDQGRPIHLTRFCVWEGCGAAAWWEHTRPDPVDDETMGRAGSESPTPVPGWSPASAAPTITRLRRIIDEAESRMANGSPGGTIDDEDVTALRDAVALLDQYAAGVTYATDTTNPPPGAATMTDDEWEASARG